MLRCSHCKAAILSPQIERDLGDWIVTCPCGAKNILAPTVINLVPLPSLEIIGYRE